MNEREYHSCIVIYRDATNLDVLYTLRIEVSPLGGLISLAAAREMSMTRSVQVKHEHVNCIYGQPTLDEKREGFSN
jgi:hypothetical protein